MSTRQRSARVATRSEPQRSRPAIVDLAGDAGGELDDDISSSQETYRSIKGMILGGEVWPGRKLVHQDLATFLNVSRTPVREALERLHQEGLVTRLPRRGFYVAEMTREEARDLYDAREALEIHALRQTMSKGPLTRRTLSEVSQLIDRTHDLLLEGKLRERQLTDAMMHIKLAELSGNRYLVRLLIQTFERITLKRRIEGYRSDRGTTAHSDHRDLLDSLVKNDIRRAEKTLRGHIGGARDALLNTLEERGMA